MSVACKASSPVGLLWQLIISFVVQAGSVESRAGAVTEGGVHGQGYQLGITPSSAGALATAFASACML